MKTWGSVCTSARILNFHAWRRSVISFTARVLYHRKRVLGNSGWTPDSAWTLEKIKSLVPSGNRTWNFSVVQPVVPMPSEFPASRSCAEIPCNEFAEPVRAEQMLPNPSMSGWEHAVPETPCSVLNRGQWAKSRSRSAVYRRQNCSDSNSAPQA
jgi:hypothetical protein